MPKNRTELSVDLKVLKVGEDKFSTMTLEFPKGADRTIKSFEPDRLYLEDAPGDRYGLVDGEGHRYCGIEKHEEWIEAAQDRGLYFLVMQSDHDDGNTTGRILVVQYPFGRVLRDTEVFQTDAQELTLGMLDGRLIQKAIRGIKLQELKLKFSETIN
jgi:hypothetical protein